MIRNHAPDEPIEHRYLNLSTRRACESMDELVAQLKGCRYELRTQLMDGFVLTTGRELID